MIGLEGAAKLIVELLEAKVPDKLTEIETRLSLASGSITPPAVYSDHDRPQLALEEWPALMVIGQSFGDLVRLDVIDNDVSYDDMYAFRVYVYARGLDFNDTDKARKRLTLGVREVLLSDQTLGDQGRLNELSYRESYSDIAVDPDSSATIAASYAEFEVRLGEVLGAVAPGTIVPIANTVTVHPAFED